MTPEIKDEVTKDLKEYWHFYRKGKYFAEKEKFAGCMIGPEGYVLQLGNTTTQLTSADLARFCNNQYHSIGCSLLSIVAIAMALSLPASINSGFVFMMIIPISNSDISSRIRFK
jgi:hypothetical protein